MEQWPDKEENFHIQDNTNLQDKNIVAARLAYKEGKYSEALNLYLGVIHKVLDSEIYVETGNCYYKLNLVVS